MAKRGVKAAKQKVGRPTDYSDAIATLICERVATSTLGLRKLCEKYDDMPVKSTVDLWRMKHPEFSVLYAHAKGMQADLLAEECLDIADDATNDWMETVDENGQLAYRFNGEHVQRSRVRIDTRKWIAAKLMPKVYGDRPLDDNTKKKADSLIERLINQIANKKQ